jgi:hypothetical protein
MGVGNLNETLPRRVQLQPQGIQLQCQALQAAGLPLRSVAQESPADVFEGEKTRRRRNFD